MKPMFTGGRWTAAQDERTIPVIAPENGETFDHVPRGETLVLYHG